MSATLLLALALAAPGPKDPPKKDAPAPVGEWEVESVVIAGKPRALGPNPLYYTFTADGKWHIHRAAGIPPATDRAYYFDPKADPPTIDLNHEPAEQEVRLTRGIYKIEGDTLTICLGRGRTGRPKAFESTAEAPTTLYVFKRVKPKD
jgi:uncharacterized protein (TIGR03067 family)